MSDRTLARTLASAPPTQASSQFAPRPFEAEDSDVSHAGQGGGTALSQYSFSNLSVTAPVQPKLTLGQPGDTYEQEADQVAAQVMQMPASPVESAQRKSQDGLHHSALQRFPQEEEEIQQKSLITSITPLLQRQELPEEEELQAKPIQRQELPEEEDLQTKPIQRQELPEEEELQAKPIQRQELPEEEELQAKPIQRQELPEEEELQAKPIQRQELPEEEELQAKPIQRQELPEEEELQAKLAVQAKGKAAQIPNDFEARLASYQGSGEPLADGTRDFMESRFGADFSDVRVHQAPQESQAIGAQAFTHGKDIFFNAGKYAPDSNTGKLLLAHELTHTIQQTGGKIRRKPNKLQLKTATPEKDSHSADEEQHLHQTESEDPAETEEIDGESSAEGAVGDDSTDEASGGEAVTDAPPTVDQEESGLAEGDLESEPALAESGIETPQPQAGATAPKSPHEDPGFQAVVKNTKAAAANTKRHGSATAKSQAAQAAAVPPAGEVTSKAQANQIDSMERAETPGFDKAAFKAKLMQRIQGVAPKNLKEANDFKSNNKLAAVKGEMASKVQEEKNASQKPLDEKTKQAPDTSGIEPKPVTPLPPVEEAQPPAEVQAGQAVPKSKGQSEVEAPFSESSQNLDQEMAAEDITEEQLEKSGEPEFKAALDAKQTAQADAKIAPEAYRQHETNQLNQAQGDATETAQQKLQGMQDDRVNGLAQVLNQQNDTKGKDEEARAKVADDIQRLYDTAKTKVEKILADLDGKVSSLFDAGAARAQKDFATFVDQRMSAYKSRRYAGLRGKGRWLRDRFRGLPSEVNTFYQQGRELYVNQMNGVIDQAVNLIDGELTRAKSEIAIGRQQVHEYVIKLPEDLKTIGQEAADNIQSEFDGLEQSVDNKQDDLIDSLAQKYQQNLQAIDADIEKRKEANKGLIAKAIGGIKAVISTIKKLKDMLISVLKGAAAALKAIIRDPIGFLGKLIGGIKKGFDNFVGNILKHLQSGLLGWLTGAMGAVGIQIPKDIFSLPGIFDLVTQILGLTWNYIRTKAVKLMGEPVVAAAEKTSKVFKLLQGKGALGLWDYVKDQFNDLRETIMDQIKDMVVVQVIQAGVKWILGLLNPASAFIKACIAIYDIVMFFVRQGRQIVSLVEALIDGVKAIASGSAEAVGKAIEGALAKSLPVVIGFLASIAGVSGIAGKVQGIVKKIRSRIDKAIDKLLAKVKGLFKGKKGSSKTQKPDERSPKEKELALERALEESDELIKNKSFSKKDIKKKLPAIQDKYNMKCLNLVEEGKENKRQKVYVEGSINPKGRTTSGYAEPEDSGEVIRIESELGAPQSRAGEERKYPLPKEYKLGKDSNSPYQWAHSQGPGTGDESELGIRLAPRFVNLKLQNQGIEKLLRALVKKVENDPNTKLFLITETRTIKNTLRLKSITYQVEAETNERRRIVLTATINIVGIKEKPSAKCSIDYVGSEFQDFLVAVSEDVFKSRVK